MGEIVCDAIELLRNCGQAVRLSALHTYYSTLPLTPKTRELFKCYSGKAFGIPDVMCSHPLWGSISVRVLEGHAHRIDHVMFSPDLHPHRATTHYGSGTSKAANPSAMHSNVIPTMFTMSSFHQTEGSLHQHCQTARCNSGISRTVDPSAMHSKLTPVASITLFIHFHFNHHAKRQIVVMDVLIS